MRPSRLFCLFAAAWVAACANARFDRPGAGDEADYAAHHPYYAEFCALSQIKKKPGFGADIRGEIGGHSVFYLNGACLVPGEHYPVLQVCAPGQGYDGVGLSVNEHFRNVKWIATPGRDFFFHGNLTAGAPVTRETYRAVQAEAKRLGVLDGIEFHDAVFSPMPPDWRRDDWKYEMSVATDYAISLGRGRYCARVPVDRTAMAEMVAFLNRENAPYRAGAAFHWSLFRDNCIHLAHNALAAAGIWDEWPIQQFILRAILDFPVPKNEFVNLMRRTNDALPPDPGAVYADLAARRSLLEHDVLPTRIAALAEARGPQQPNEVYDTDLKMIFYDDPLLGPYQGWFDRVFDRPRYTEAPANRAHFARAARRIAAARRPLDWWLARGPYSRDPQGFALVYQRFYGLIDRMAAGQG